MNTVKLAQRLGNHRLLIRNWALIVLLVLAAGVAVGDVSPEAQRTRQRDGFTLFSGPSLNLAGNQFQCGINNIGQVCTAVGIGTTTLAGGFWPLGTSNKYVFNTGMQLAGILSDEAGPWAGDTIGAYIFDATFVGSRHATSLTNIFDSLDPDDLEVWPAEAYVEDPEIFAPILLGRKTASQQDSWVQYWDGDPVRNSNRQHPLGVKITQRSMSWNYPSGNESIIYFLFEFENITGDGEFQRLNEQFFFGGDPALPDAGWSLTELYAQFGTDMDVGNTVSDNFSTAILPFDAGLSYIGGFYEPQFAYPPSVFFPPFFTNAPGMVGIKYLKSPLDPQTGEEVGLTQFTVTGWTPGGNPLGLPDPAGDTQLWRYMSGQLDAGKGDGACNVEAEIATANPATTQRSVCVVAQQQGDTRFYQASGPFDLGPGQSGTIVVAYIAAATVETMPDGTESGIVPDPANANRNPPGVPSFHPDFASARGCDINGASCSVNRSATENAVLPIEKGAGWIRYEGSPPSGSVYPPSVEHPSNKIEQYEVRVVPGSFLGRALVAQTVFDNQFLLGFSPEPPAFYLVPGDDQVTVMWEPSATETLGDPFYEVASDPESALYNPNYRQFDVEGYRVWRSTTVGGAELIAQFDHADTRFLDHTCETVHPDEDVGTLMPRPDVGDSVPVFGYAAGEVCPFNVDDPVVRPIDGQLVFNNGGPGGPPGGGVARDPAAVHVDTAILADRVTGPVQPLRDTGVPYVYIDADVVNNFTYFYSVTSFDLNSMASGPHTLRTAQVSQAVTPRADAPNLVAASLTTAILGDDGEPLDPDALVPSVDPENGTFSGPFPSTNGVEQTFAPLLPRLLAEFELAAVIDSVKPDWVLEEECIPDITFRSTCWRMWLTVDGVQSEVAGAASNWNVFGRPGSIRTLVVDAEVPFDSSSLEAFGIPEASGAAQAYVQLDESIQFINWEGQQNRRGATANTLHGGPRWFNGTAETTANPDPTAFIKVGQLAEVDSVFIPIHHTDQGPGVGALPNSSSVQYFGYYLAFLGRAADIQVTWTGGAITVRDVSNNVEVPFSGEYGSSWGFLNDDGDGDGTVSWWDFFCVGADAKAEWEFVFGEICPITLSLSQTPTIHSIAMDTGGAPVPTGNGFTLYLNGMRHFFLADAVPADGTVWTLRTYNGSVTASSGLDTFDPSGYAYVPIYDPGFGQSGQRSPLIPGLTIGWKVESNTAATGPVDLAQVHTVPDPYLGSSRYDRAPTTKKFMFVNLPPTATIRIYSVTGILVDIVNHDDTTGGGRAEWDMRNRNNQFVASAVYFYHVVTPEGEEHVGKFTVVNAVQ